MMLSLVPLLLASFSVETMTLEEKVGQVLMVHFHGESANDDARVLVNDCKVGAFIYYNWANGLNSPAQVAELSSTLQTLAAGTRLAIPLLIAADQEGGVVARLQTGFTVFPGNRALGQTNDPTLAKAAAMAMGQELRSVGINMNLAPVVDVNSNPRNPVIGIRAFGDDPEIVTTFGKQAVDGFQEANVIATLKHFPGYGDVAVDPHEDLPIILKSKQQLEEVELVPFAKLARSAEAIMTAHILVPALDREHCSTLSETTIHYLRKTIGFEGVVVADSLVMKGVLKTCQTVDEAAIQALNAGCDLLILGGKLIDGEYSGFELTTPDVIRIHRSMVEAVKSGRISRARLDEAVDRVVRLKERYLQAPTAQKLARIIATKAIQAVERKPMGRLSEKRVVIVAPKIVQSALEKSSLPTLGKSTEVVYFETASPSSEEIASVLEKIAESDVVVVCSYNTWRSRSVIAMTESVAKVGKPLIVLCLRDPLDSDLFPTADLILTSYSPTAPSMEAMYESCCQLR